MSPQYIPVPSPTTGMIVSGVIALAVLLLLSAILGAIGKKKWQSFEEYLVGRRDIGPLITGAALSASYISGWAFCGSTGIVYTLGFSGMWFAGIWSLVGIIPCIWLAAMKTRESWNRPRGSRTTDALPVPLAGGLSTRLSRFLPLRG